MAAFSSEQVRLKAVSAVSERPRQLFGDDPQVCNN